MAQQMCSQCGRLVAPASVKYIDRKSGVASTGRTGFVFLLCCTLSATGLASVPLFDATLWHYAADGFSPRALLAMFGLSMIVLFFLALTIRSSRHDWNAELVCLVNYECHGCRQCWNWRTDQPFGIEYVTTETAARTEKRHRNATLVR